MSINRAKVKFIVHLARLFFKKKIFLNQIEWAQILDTHLKAMREYKKTILKKKMKLKTEL